jgi:hypothetical protein
MGEGILPISAQSHFRQSITDFGLEPFSAICHLGASHLDRIYVIDKIKNVKKFWHPLNSIFS